jgi:polysaccharide pyruvyl transferase WcaK-like protein
VTALKPGAHQGGATGPLRLFHFDIPTAGNFGDLVLFNAVRQVFNSFTPASTNPWAATPAGPAARTGSRNRADSFDAPNPAEDSPGRDAGFCVEQTRNLRRPVDPIEVDRINQTADAVVVGGGGLFLRDIVPDSPSGWQWNIPASVLERFEVPLVVYAVGNNRFPGQSDFPPPFREHLIVMARKAVFFGLRSNGSMESIAKYLPSSLAQTLTMQPCPTALASYLYPDLTDGPRDTGRRIAVQCSIDDLQRRAGFDADRIYAAEISVLRRLAREGWEIDSVPHDPLDLGFATVLGAEGFLTRARPLRGDPSAATAGLSEFAQTPLVLATRGHAQVIPFGMGAIPIALGVHNKIRWFAEDIGHPELVIDPRTDTFAEDLYHLINATWERQADLRDDFARRRHEFLEMTEANLASIYASLRRPSGQSADAGPHPANPPSGIVQVASIAANAYTPRERRLARESLTNAIAADDAETLAEVELARAEAEVNAQGTRAAEGRLSDEDFLTVLRHRARAAKRDRHRLEAACLGVAILLLSHRLTKAARAARRGRWH